MAIEVGIRALFTVLGAGVKGAEPSEPTSLAHAAPPTGEAVRVADAALFLAVLVVCPAACVRRLQGSRANES